MYIIQRRHTLTTHFQHQPFVWFPHFTHKKSFFLIQLNTRVLISTSRQMYKLRLNYWNLLLNGLFSNFLLYSESPLFALKMKIKFYFKSRGSKNKTSSIYMCMPDDFLVRFHAYKHTEKKRKENEIMMVFQSIIKISLNYT